MTISEEAGTITLMRLGLLALPLLALPLACSFASQGEPEVGGDDELVNTDSETDADSLEGDELGTDQGTSGESTGDGDGDGDDDDDDESTTDMTSDDDPSTESSTDSSDTTTDTTDTTDDATTETTTDTGEDEETTTDTGDEETFYGNCPNGVDDCAPDEVCRLDADFNDSWQVCAELCNNSNDCPDAGGLPLSCISYNFQAKSCHINCDNVACPDGMACKAVNVGWNHICAYES